MQQCFRVGLDVGSTTAKVVLIDQYDNILFSDYCRHQTRIHDVVHQQFEKIKTLSGDQPVCLHCTGSAGLGLSEKLQIPFVQEVIASAEVIKNQYPQVKTLIDIGGEDSKMIFFNDNKPPDIRMNGNCAGGTGAFIDQMASLLHVSLSELDKLAANHQNIYTIASRCGVFAKTDVQNLISRKIPKEDIAASVFQAVAIQTMNTLARGFDIVPKIMYIGGPFTFLPYLGEIFSLELHLKPKDRILTQHAELIPAIGAALSRQNTEKNFTIDQLQEKLANSTNHNYRKNRLTPLFESKEEFNNWHQKRINIRVPETKLKDYKENACFLGIDSGSTTTKIAVTGTKGELLFGYYAPNKGNAIEAVMQGLEAFKKQVEDASMQQNLHIARTAVTGYGEDLIRAAYGVDTGIVETIAHYIAAQFFIPDVSFVLDIGGQDMKAVFVHNGTVNRIELNESCSSGCGSFIQTFGDSLGYQIANFANLACLAKAPADLGTRCTVFMNSKVKQSLRENATVEDIAAGLSISVIKNALFKVLKLHDVTEMGKQIVVQGGTFKNASVHRALETLAGCKVNCTNIPELMGAYGAALTAMKQYHKTETSSGFVSLDRLHQIEQFKTKQLHCKGCENNCTITRFTFANGNMFYSGNKCEKIYSEKGESSKKGFNLFQYKLDLLFQRSGKAKDQKPTSKTQTLRIGFPRVLNFYENYPFWNTLFTACGIEVVLSEPSTMKIYQKGLGSVMSDSICFPAKIVHGHIIQLAETGVDRIFYPIVYYERNEYEQTINSFNCPIVSSYPDVIRSSVNPGKRFRIPFDTPTITFDDIQLLRKACFTYLKKLGVKKMVFEPAFQKSMQAQHEFKQQLRKKAKEIIDRAIAQNRTLTVVASRPYQVDELINHKSTEILTGMGVDVISEDAVPHPQNIKLDELHVLSQWTYTNRLYHAAHWVGKQKQNIQFVQLNSFGCGPDAISIDETVQILKSYNKNHTLIRLDDITSTGSIRLRLRSMIESLRINPTEKKALQRSPRPTTSIFHAEDVQRTIIAPNFATMYSPFLPALFSASGYKLEILPEPDNTSVNLGLKYANNEICYPATIIVGDIIKALQSGKYERSKTAVAITQTGGQCRASTYLSLIKKAMVAAGFSDIPVVAVCTGGEAMNKQPGFQIEWKKIMTIAFAGALYADSLAKMYYSTVVREKHKGTTKAVLQKYQKLANDVILIKSVKEIYRLLKQAVEAFNQIETNNKQYPKIGVVGEIYVKYNSFGNNYAVDWLIEQGIEVVVPPLIEFFTHEFINFDVKKKAHLERASLSDIYVFFIENFAKWHINRVNRILSRFKFYDPFHNIRDLSKKASNILNLANQFGEGWLIPAEIAAFAEQGINNVISLQPFGCIANQIIAKGVEKRIRDLYPDMNLLFLDFDNGTTEANMLNRLHFMVENVQESESKQSVNA